MSSVFLACTVGETGNDTLQFSEDQPAKLKAFRSALEPLRQTLKQFKFLGGNKISYADIAVAGNFMVRLVQLSFFCTHFDTHLHTGMTVGSHALLLLLSRPTTCMHRPQSCSIFQFLHNLSPFEAVAVSQPRQQL